MTTFLRRLLRKVRGRSGRNIIITTVTTYIGMGLSLASTPILAHSIGADGRGVLAGSFAFVQLLGWMGFFSIPRVLGRDARTSGRISRPAFIWLLALGFANTVVAVLFADVLANGDARMAWGIRLAAFLLVFTGISLVGIERCLADGRIILYNLTRLGYMAVPSVGVIVLFLGDALTTVSAFIVTLLGQAVTTFLGCVVFFWFSKIRGTEPLRWAEPLRFWSANALDSIVGQLGQILLAALSTAQELGVFAVAVTLSVASTAAVQAVTSTTYSRFLVDADSGSIPTALMRTITRLGVALTILVGGVVLVVIEIYGSAIFGPTFANLTWATAFLLCAQLMSEQWQVRVNLDLANRRPRGLALSSAAGAIVAVSCGVLVGVIGELTAVSMGMILCVALACRLSVRALMVGRIDRLKRPKK